MQIDIQMLDPDLPAPKFAHVGDAGADLVSRVDMTLLPGERALIPTGFKIALPQGYAGFVHPRSGLALRHGITVLNAPGTIDAGYRGEVGVILLNTDSRYAFQVTRGDRIAQLVVQQIVVPDFEIVEVLDETVRGEGGFGSTGSKTATPALP